MKRKYIATLLISILVLLPFGLLVYANISITNCAKGKTYNDIDEVPYVKVGLLLGTSKKVVGGRENLYFKNRISAAVALINSHKIRYLIISGDNGTRYYDEPNDMRKELIKRGVDSTKIYLDHAGFRTFDSMVRAQKIFGQDTLIVISQKFHNERALFIATKIGINAIGYNAEDVTKAYGWKTSIREKFARVKVLLDFLVGTQPKYMGERIDIP